ncbi:zinc finger protein [Ditylenchus destructor]|nr:zinc finger protein [Ditylenchus destructor]
MNNHQAGFNSSPSGDYPSPQSGFMPPIRVDCSEGSFGTPHSAQPPFMEHQSSRQPTFSPSFHNNNPHQQPTQGFGQQNFHLQRQHFQPQFSAPNQPHHSQFPTQQTPQFSQHHQSLRMAQPNLNGPEGGPAPQAHHSPIAMSHSPQHAPSQPQQQFYPQNPGYNNTLHPSAAAVGHPMSMTPSPTPLYDMPQQQSHSNSPYHQHHGNPMASTSNSVSPNGNQSLMVPIKDRKSSKDNICDMITSMMADDSSDSPMQHQQTTPAVSRKSTVEWTTNNSGSYGGYSEGMVQPLLANNMQEMNNNNTNEQYRQNSTWPPPSDPSDYYRRKESLPSMFRLNSPMMSPPDYLQKCERSRSMSTVVPPSNSYHNGVGSHMFNQSQSINFYSSNMPNGPTTTQNNGPYITPASNTAPKAVKLEPADDGDKSNDDDDDSGEFPRVVASRRSKSTACNSLHRFSSLLRKVSFVPPPAPNGGSMTAFNPLLAFTPYTPPPILSPMRSGTGLFCQVARSTGIIEHKLSLHQRTSAAGGEGDPSLQQQCKKISAYLSQEKRLMTIGDPSNQQLTASAAMPSSTANEVTEEDDSIEECSMSATTAPGEENHRRARVNDDGECNEENNENCPSRKRRRLHKLSSSSTAIMSQDFNGGHKRSLHALKLDDQQEEMSERRRLSCDGSLGHKLSVDGPLPTTPQRKNGLFLSGTAQSGSGSAFAAELEALRKESASSSVSNLSTPFHKASTSENQSTYHPRMTMRNKLSITSEDFIRKMSSVSMDESKARKESHINLGKHFQARVKKWADREITAVERAAIPDRDELVFDSKVVDHLPESAIAAYETLACSVAIPRPGRNKELALHILMENQGNIQAAVMDLLRSDTLDWEQYPSVYNNLYADVDQWTPEDINCFQDAIYKSEKDFHQVASELGNRTVKESVAFYYTWKKACPDDYRKLRNLRRKRQLLEQQLDFSTFTSRARSQSDPLDSSDGEFSGTESDITNPSYVNPHNMECSPAFRDGDETRAEKLARVNQTKSPIPVERKTSTIRFNVPNASTDLSMSSPLGLSAFNSNNTSNNTGTSSGGPYPWLHGEMFPSPTSSTTSTAHESTTGNMGTGYGSGPNASSSGLSDLFDMTGVEPSIFNSGYSAAHKVRGTVTKKGAQPSADGFFHCRLCEKRFEKVKSLNAHMKSHAMKARAEAEAQAQLQQQQQQAASSGVRFPGAKVDGSDILLQESPDDELSPLNLCQTSSAANLAAAALGLRNFGAAKMGLSLNPRDLMSAAMNHLANNGTGGPMGHHGGQQTNSFNHHSQMGTGEMNPGQQSPHQQLAAVQQAAAMAAVAAGGGLNSSSGHHPNLDMLGGAAAMAAATTLQQLHSNLQQQQNQMPHNFQNPQSQQPPQYPTTIIH